MPIEELSNTKEVANSVFSKDISLWVLPNTSEEELRVILDLPWKNIWVDSLNFDFVKVWEEFGDNREILYIDNPNKEVEFFRESEFVRVYNISKTETESQKNIRYKDRLIDKVEDAKGLIIFIGEINSNIGTIKLVHELSANINILLLNNNKEKIQLDEDLYLYSWEESLDFFIRTCKKTKISSENENIVHLKNAFSLQLNKTQLEEVKQYWTLLSAPLINIPNNFTQKSFDSFINSDDAWDAYSLEAPFYRKKACKRKTINGVETFDFIEEAEKKIKWIDKKSLEPNEQFSQIILYCEPGSGATTLLRQTAMKIARLGYPTLISNPHFRSFGGKSLENFIIDTQELWLKEQGSKKGQIPFCIIVDTDGEAIPGSFGFPRMLQALGRKILLIRAMERTKDEILEDDQFNALFANVEYEEIIQIGSHLRNISLKYNLDPIPDEFEWRSFYEGIGKLSKFGSEDYSNVIPSQPLFLIGIYPFLKERVNDENSLEQYYYSKWDKIKNKDLKDTIYILANIGVYGFSVPYDTLRRIIDMTNLHSQDKFEDRVSDMFIRWNQYGQITQNWYLHIRHPAIGMLLSRAINPSEGDFPFSAILPLLKSLSTKEEDLWLAGGLSYRIGQHFKRRSGQFSLDVDTAAQRASREIFSAIPNSVKSVSRTVRHHQGRYHLHILRACLESISNQHLTTLKKEEIIDLAQKEHNKASEFLELATRINQEAEPISYIYNTLATVNFTLSEVLKNKDSDLAFECFKKAIEYEDISIKYDPANGHALFQFVSRILNILNNSGSLKQENKVELIVLSESRLMDLERLHEEKRWRNIDPIEAEKQIGSLFQDHYSLVEEIIEHTNNPNEYRAENEEANIFLKIRMIIKRDKLNDALKDRNKREKIKLLREQLSNLENITIRSLLYIYKLLVADTEDRLNFEKRLKILEQIKLKDPEQFLSYKHDYGALYCQINKIDVGEGILREIREFRSNNRTQWFWNNEKALLESENRKQPRELVLQVVDPIGCWAVIRNTSIKLKYQNYHFGEKRKQEVFKSFIRFTLNGLQAVPSKLIEHDLKEIGLR